MKDLPVNCQNVKNVSTVCSNVYPNKINWLNIGPSLTAVKGFQLCDGHTISQYPTNDPCGEGNSSNYNKGVENFTFVRVKYVCVVYKILCVRFCCVSMKQSTA